MKEIYLENGVYYRKSEHNNKRKKLIVFIHGISGSSSAWKKYESALGKKYNVLSLDIRGHGKSLKINDVSHYKIEKFAEDVYEIIKKEKIKKFIVVSHSYGSLIALKLIENHQNNIIKAIFLSPHYKPGEMLSAKIAKPFLIISSKIVNIFPLIKKSGTHIDYKNHIDTGDWNIRRMYADVTNTSLNVFLKSIVNAYRFDGKNILNKIKIPVLIVHGEKDSIFPVKYGKYMADKIKNSKFEMIEGADHILVLNYPKEIIRKIESFIMDG